MSVTQPDTNLFNDMVKVSQELDEINKNKDNDDDLHSRLNLISNLDSDSNFNTHKEKSLGMYNSSITAGDKDSLNLHAHKLADHTKEALDIHMRVFYTKLYNKYLNRYEEKTTIKK